MKKRLPFTPSTRLYYAEKLPDVAVIFAGDRILLRRHEDNFFLPRTEDENFAFLFEMAGRALCVGNFCGMECGVWDMSANHDSHWQAPADTEFVEIRYAMHNMDQMSVMAIARARELLFWRRKRNFCGVCGAELLDNEEDISRICPECSSTFYPVVAPAVIVAVQRDDSLLLAHNARFKDGLYGLVAGFVETGENLESAVIREVREEVGIEIGNLRYFSSQVWPFPNSLMVGFFADYAGGEIKVDGVEITDAGWFRKDEFPEIPRHGSIARRLIDEFAAAK